MKGLQAIRPHFVMNKCFRYFTLSEVESTEK